MTAAAKILGQQDVPGKSSSPPSPAIMPPLTGGRRDATDSSSTDARTTKHAPLSFLPNTFVKRYRTEIAASSSSVFSTLAAFPLDSVKTRMQTYHYKGFLDCVKHTYHSEKLGGFFRGTPALSSVACCSN